jgi:hypothetical protein
MLSVRTDCSANQNPYRRASLGEGRFLVGGGQNDLATDRAVDQPPSMALDIPSGDHPNRKPFKGVLVHLDRLSDGAPAGTNGRRIIVTAAAGKNALSSLLGMAVNSSPSLDGHDAKNKIGVITSADIVGNAIRIAGFVYAADFPETANTIKALKNDLGFSFEAQHITVLDPHAAVLTITELAFTGAAILLKSKAAFATTSLAASATNERTKIMNWVTPTNITPRTRRRRSRSSSTSARKSLLETLTHLGFTVPESVTALAAANQPLGSGGHTIDLYQLDQVLAGYDV